MNAPLRDMNSCKVIQAQSISMKAIWFSAHGGRGRVKFAGAKKLLADGEELNTLVASYMAKDVKINKKSKEKATDNITHKISPSISILKI